MSINNGSINNSNINNSSSSNSTPGLGRRRRAAVACTSCRRSKVKCVLQDDLPPCHGCSQRDRGSECRVVPVAEDEREQERQCNQANNHLTVTLRVHNANGTINDYPGVIVPPTQQDGSRFLVVLQGFEAEDKNHPLGSYFGEVDPGTFQATFPPQSIDTYPAQRPRQSNRPAPLAIDSQAGLLHNAIQNHSPNFEVTTQVVSNTPALPYQYTGAQYFPAVSTPQPAAFVAQAPPINVSQTPIYLAHDPSSLNIPPTRPNMGQYGASTLHLNLPHALDHIPRSYSNMGGPLTPNHAQAVSPYETAFSNNSQYFTPGPLDAGNHQMNGNLN